MNKRLALWVIVVNAAIASAATLVAVKATATGAPSKGALTYTGYLEDGSGAPVTTQQMIGLAVYDNSTAGSKVCEVEAKAITPVAGQFQMQLPDTCVAVVSTNSELWLEVSVAAVPLGRTKLGAVPYAVEAEHAQAADTAANAALLAGNAPSAFQRPFKGSCPSGIASVASDGTTTCNSFSAFRKNGNNGSVSCSTFCTGSQWGGASATGTCVGARKTVGQEWVSCEVTNFVDNAQNLDCWCARPTD